MHDLTAYLVGPTEAELDRLLDLYESVCPQERSVNYKISELPYWAPLQQPVLTAQGRSAARAGKKRPQFETIRGRIRDGRGFELQLWDGRSIDDEAGSWSFSCRCLHLRSTGLHAFVRIVLPLGADYTILVSLARAVLSDIDIYSGHAGYAFLYDPLRLADAMDAIYAKSRRFWGVDIENLTQTVPLMRDRIKGASWVTMLGRVLSKTAEGTSGETLLQVLRGAPDVMAEQCGRGILAIAGGAPVAGDQNRPDPQLDPYYAVARAVAPLYLEEHPDFPGPKFLENGNTLGWIRRFLDPSGWR